MSDYNQTDDPNGVFETVIEKTVTVGFGNFSIDVTGGTWAPYRFASNFNDGLSLIHFSEPTRQEAISYAVFCLKKIFGCFAPIVFRRK